MKRNRNNLTKTEKTLGLAKTAVSLVILVAAILDFLNVWPKALNLAIPLFAVYYFLETISSWKNDKDLAAFNLFMSVIVTAVSCIVFFL